MKTNIKSLRREIKVSQQVLGEAVGVTRQTINALENGRYNPSLLLAYKITQFLNEQYYEDNIEEYYNIEDVFIMDDEDGGGI